MNIINNMSVRKITVGGLMLAFAILLPQFFHLTAVPQSGQIFLPMHIPVLLGGFTLGPVFGLFIGIISPLVSCLITGMPALDRVLFMVVELAGYGFVSGFAYNILGLRKRKFGIYTSLIIAMAAGRLLYGLSLLFAGTVLGFSEFGFMAMLGATVSGIWGIVIQLIFLPSLVYGLERSGNLDKFIRKSKKPVI